MNEKESRAELERAKLETRETLQELNEYMFGDGDTPDYSVLADFALAIHRAQRAEFEAAKRWARASRAEPEVRRQADYWSVHDQDVYSCSDLDEEIHRELDGRDMSAWPEELRVMAFVRDTVSPAMHRGLVTHLMEESVEYLDQEYGDFDNGDPCIDAEDLRRAATACANRVVANYRPWTVSRAPELDVMVNVLDWVREHQPQWLWEDSVKNTSHRE